MFIIFFAIFIFILTIWENIWLGGIMFGLILIGWLVFAIVKNRTNWYKIFRNKKRLYEIFFLFVAFLLATGSRISYNYFHEDNFDFLSTNHHIVIEHDGNFMGQGMIEDTYTQGKYIFNDGRSSYVLYTKKEYAIGDNIFLMGRRSSGTFSGSAMEQGFLSFDYTRWLKMKGWKGVIYETNSFPQQDDSGKNSTLGWIKQLKKGLQQKIISAYGKDRISGLVLGMLIGDRSQIPKDDYQRFINSGLVHIIAVSGGNVVMITVFLGFALFFLPFYIRMFIILMTVILYGLICGLDSSVFRAVVTGGLSLIALFRGKEIPIWRLLSIAFIGMLVVNPYYLVYDVGFVMSFTAVIGIICIGKIGKEESEKSEKGCVTLNRLPRTGGEMKAISNKKLYPSNSLRMTAIQGGQKLGHHIRKNYLQPSVGATFGVFPIIIFFMGRINLLSVLTNLFVLPLLAIVMIYGFISVYLYQFLGRSRLLRIEKILICYIYKVSELSSAFGLYLSMDGWVKRVVLMGFLGWFVYWKLTPSVVESGRLRKELNGGQTHIFAGCDKNEENDVSLGRLRKELSGGQNQQ